MTQKPRNADYTKRIQPQGSSPHSPPSGHEPGRVGAGYGSDTGGGFFDRGGASERRRCDGTCPPVRRTGAQCHAVGSAGGQLLCPRGGLGQKGLHGGTVRYRRQPAAMPGAAGAKQHDGRHRRGACVLLESVDRRKVLGIGISAPGPLDCKNGRILNPPRFERWHGMDIGKRLSDALGLPAYLEHDVWRHGAASAKHRAEPELYAAFH